MRNPYFIICLAAVMVLVGCKKTPAPDKMVCADPNKACSVMSETLTNSVHNLGEPDNGTTLTVKRGQSIKVCISLPANPTTGYNWYPRSLPSFVTAEEQMYHPEKTDRVGSGGVWMVILEIKGEASGEIAIDYKREFEKDKAPDKTFTVKVDVK